MGIALPLSNDFRWVFHSSGVLQPWLVCRLIAKGAVSSASIRSVHGYHDLGAFTDHIEPNRQRGNQDVGLGV